MRQWPAPLMAANATGTQTLATPIQRFNAHLDSLFEFGVVMIVGAYYAVARVPVEAIAVIVILFFVIRPAAVFAGLYGTRLDREQRVLAAWFGIRGVGSIYYAMYAINHGLPAPRCAAGAGDHHRRRRGVDLPARDLGHAADGAIRPRQGAHHEETQDRQTGAVSR